MRTPTDAEANALIGSTDVVWHQSFPLSEGVRAPGVNVIENLFSRSSIPASLDGLSVLDIGTTNGGAAFEAERRGASRVVAVDICDDQRYGFGAIAALLGSSAEFLTSTVYDLDLHLDEQFDIVILWGVLYHLRHPLLGLDAVRRHCRGLLTVETVVDDATDRLDAPIARFHRLDDLGGDATNWWSPTTSTLRAWLGSAGFTVTKESPAPADGPAERTVVDAVVTPGEPEYRLVSYEFPLHTRSPLAPLDGNAPAATLDDVVALRAVLLGDTSGRHHDDEARHVAGDLARDGLAGATARWIASDQFVATWPTNRSFSRMQGDGLHHELAALRPVVHIHASDDGPDALDLALASTIDPSLVQVGRTLDEILSLPLTRLLGLRLVSGAHGRTIASLLRARHPFTVATVIDPVTFHVAAHARAVAEGLIDPSLGLEQWLEHTDLPGDPQVRALAADALDDRPAPTGRAALDLVVTTCELVTTSERPADALATITSAAGLPVVHGPSFAPKISPSVTPRALDLITERATCDLELHTIAAEGRVAQ